MEQTESSELRARSIELMEWARQCFRPTSDRHSEISLLIARLLDENTTFGRDGNAEQIAAIREFGEAATKAGMPGVLPMGFPLDPSSVRSLAEAAVQSIKALNGRCVTFSDVRSVLRGDFGETSLATEINDLLADFNKPHIPDAEVALARFGA